MKIMIVQAEVGLLSPRNCGESYQCGGSFFNVPDTGIYNTYIFQRTIAEICNIRRMCTATSRPTYLILYLYVIYFLSIHATSTQYKFLTLTLCVMRVGQGQHQGQFSQRWIQRYSGDGPLKDLRCRGQSCKNPPRIAEIVNKIQISSFYQC